MILELPYPPSVNNYWRSWQGRTLLSREGRRFRKAVVELVSLLRVRPLEGPLDLTVTIHPPDNRRRDLDNVLKSILDALGHAGVYEDDSQIVHIDAHKGRTVRPAGLCVVGIKHFRERSPDARVLV